MGLFDIFKKKADAPQKTFICARCKKEINENEIVHNDEKTHCKSCAAQIDMLNKLRMENAEIVDKHYKVAGYGRGQERELIVLFKSENYGYFSIKQIRCLAYAGCAYQLVPKDILSPSAEMFASDNGYSAWFGE